MTPDEARSTAALDRLPLWILLFMAAVLVAIGFASYGNVRQAEIPLRGVVTVKRHDPERLVATTHNQSATTRQHFVPERHALLVRPNGESRATEHRVPYDEWIGLNPGNRVRRENGVWRRER